MPSIRTFLLGGGGHGRVLLDALCVGRNAIAGILDPGLPAGGMVMGVKVLGGDELLKDFFPVETRLVNGVGTGRRDVARREAVFTRCSADGFEFVSVVHPSSVIASDVQLLAGAQIMAGAIVQCGTRVGRNAVINTGARIDHDCVVSDHAFIAPGVTLCGGVTIGAGSFVGAGAVVCPGIRVGQGVLLGAGSVVTSDVPDNAFYIGIPARSVNRN